MTLRRSTARVAAAAAALVILAGCGGGGGGDSSSDDASMPAAAGAPVSAVAAAPTDQLYGTLDAPAAVDVVASLPGYDQMGSPRDAFVPIVKDDAGSSGNAPGAASSVNGTSPDSAPNPPPVTPVPGVIPAPITPTPTATTPPTAPPAPSAAPAVEGYEADFDIGGQPVVARVGDAIPPESQQFTIERISLGSVVLKLNGGLLPDGSDTVTLKEGASITLVNQTTKVTYKLRLLEIRKI